MNLYYGLFVCIVSVIGGFFNVVRYIN